MRFRVLDRTTQHDLGVFDEPTGMLAIAAALRAIGHVAQGERDELVTTAPEQVTRDLVAVPVTP